MPSRQLEEKLKAGEELSPEEIRYLIESEDMKDEIQDRLRKRLIED